MLHSSIKAKKHGRNSTEKKINPCGGEADAYFIYGAQTGAKKRERLDKRGGADGENISPN